MSDGTRVLAGIACGATVGGVAAYLVLTPHGRHVIGQINPALEELFALLRECRRALRTAQQAGSEVRDMAEDVKAMMAGQALSADV